MARTLDRPSASCFNDHNKPNPKETTEYDHTDRTGDRLVDAITPTLIAVGVVNLLMFPVLAWLIKRMIGARLDTFDQKRDDAREQAVAERRLTLAMARSQLLDNYERCMDKGYYTVDEREVYHDLYDAYHKDGGNGIMDTLAAKIVRLPTEPPDGHDKGLH